MSFDEQGTTSPEPRLGTRREETSWAPNADARQPAQKPDPVTTAGPIPSREDRWGGKKSVRDPRAIARRVLAGLLTLIVVTLLGLLIARHWIRGAVEASLPQVDGSLAVAGLSAPVAVARDAHGVPHIQATSLDDLLFAQGFVTAGDRLWQMDMLRRHAAGDLAAVLGSSLVAHDKIQRVLQVRAAADRAVTQLPPDQLHVLEAYARGVNASIEVQASHLPVEFRVLNYKPQPWTPRDSLLVSLAMFQDLTTSFPAKLAREELTAQLTGPDAADILQDLYPVGSWRDHPPSSPEPDLTVPGPPIEEVPLDETQSELKPADAPLESPGGFMDAGVRVAGPSRFGLGVPDRSCPACRAGSNNWVVSGSHTATGKPLLSNDMHLTHTVPGIWYEADLQASIGGAAEPLHVAGVSIPGLPLIVVGHNQHVAWGFTNLGADVQDLYLETLRGSGSDESFEQPDGTFAPVVHLEETIEVAHGSSIHIDIAATKHGDVVTPLLTPILKDEKRPIALRWTIYDPSVLQLPVVDIASARDWPTFLAAFAKFGGPAQNVVYADDQGHIGYHATGRIPLRGPAPSLSNSAAPTLPSDIATPVAPSPSTQTPVIAATPDPLRRTGIQAPPAPTTAMLSGPISAVPVVPSPVREWTGYIPFSQLPSVYDPPGGVIATANSRITPDDYPYPITLNWGAPYRNERIWRALAQKNGLTPADMLAIQTDVYSDFDHVLGQRLAYAIDHSTRPNRSARLRQAADLLRTWNGRMTIDSPAASIVSTVHASLWPKLLASHLRPGTDPTQLYQWYERDYALEQVLMHTPPRWLPKAYANWDDFLADAVDQSLTYAKAPSDLTKWHYGTIHQLKIEHPVFGQSVLLSTLLGRQTGTRDLPQSGDGTTVKQVGHSFGPSERFTADLADLDHSTLNIVLGESGDPASPWFMDQFTAWYRGTTFPMPFSSAALSSSTAHRLTLTPR